MKDYWHELSKFTNARIALGKTGGSLPTKQLLEFNLAHAMAKDAVYYQPNFDLLAGQIHQLGLKTILLNSRAKTREMYLQRPDLGRRVDMQDILKLNSFNIKTEYDIAIIIADGLSGRAIDHQAYSLLDNLIPLISEFTIAPICLVNQGRVAIGDEIGALFKAKLSLIFIGERPGLSSPDSLGIYLTYQPKVGNTDEVRNCISNIHYHGISTTFAAAKCAYLTKEAIRKQLSGVMLKDEFFNAIEG